MATQEPRWGGLPFRPEEEQAERRARGRRRDGTTWVAPEVRRVPGPNELDQDATAAVEKFRWLIEQKRLSPWTRDVENARKNAQGLYMQMMLGHSKTPSKQSIDDMWLKTTHYWINTYRVAATRAQAALENEPPTGNNSAFHDDLNKIHTLFRQGLKNEEVVYRTLILNLVRRWGLEKMVKTPLKALGLKVKFDEAAFDRTIGFSEKKEKIRLVSFALCSLGDMQRYRGQLKQQMGLRPQGTMSSIDNGYARAREYYDCAKAINPDDGSPYHQHAVLCGLVKDDLGALYYMIRSIACKQAWTKGENAVENRMRRQLAVWKDMEAAREDGASSVLPLDEEAKVNFMAMLAVLSTTDNDVSYGQLERQVEHELVMCFKQRLLTAETIVQLTISLLGVHSQARNDAGIFRARTMSSVNRVSFEHRALGTVMRYFSVLFRVGFGDLDEIIPSIPEHHESAIVEDEQHLARLIPPALRRLLPSIRIASKWFKVNYDYLSRHQELRVWDTIQLFWNDYTTFLDSLVTVFPITQLPSITGPLEEDIDLRGFIPLTRAIVNTGGRAGGEEDYDLMFGQRPDPEEEHLMRISDILIEARLNMRNSLAQKLKSGFDPDRLENPPSPDDFDSSIWRGGEAQPIQEDDDPVRMAFRAAIDGGDALGLAAEGMEVRDDRPNFTDEEDAAEEIVFRPRNVQRTQRAERDHQPGRLQQAQHALQQVTRGISQAAITDQRPPNAPPQPRNEGSPQGLFGPSMWSLSREESQHGIGRSPSQSGQLRGDGQLLTSGLGIPPTPQLIPDLAPPPTWPAALPFNETFGANSTHGIARAQPADHQQRLQREFHVAQAAFNRTPDSPPMVTPESPRPRRSRTYR